MGRHSAPEGQPSTSEKMTGKRDHIGGAPRHAVREGQLSTDERNRQPSGSDLPPRGAGLR